MSLYKRWLRLRHKKPNEIVAIDEILQKIGELATSTLERANSLNVDHPMEEQVADKLRSIYDQLNAMNIFTVNIRDQLISAALLKEQAKKEQIDALPEVQHNDQGDRQSQEG